MPGICSTVTADRICTEGREFVWAAVTACIESAPGWVSFSGWIGVGTNVGAGTGTFRPDAVAAQTVFALAPDVGLAAGLVAVPPLADWPPVLTMFGSTMPTANTVATALRRCGPKSLAGVRATSSPPGFDFV